MENEEADRRPAPSTYRQNGNGDPGLGPSSMIYGSLGCVRHYRNRPRPGPRTGFRDPVLALTFPGPRSASCLGVARSVNEWSNTRIQGLASARPRLRAWRRICSGRMFNDPLSLCRTRAPGCPGWSQRGPLDRVPRAKQGLSRSRGLKMRERSVRIPDEESGLGEGVGQSSGSHGEP